MPGLLDLLHPTVQPIGGLLGAVTPPPMVPPQVAPQAAAVPRPSLFDRVTGRLFGDAPEAYAGMLSPQDVHRARQQSLLALAASLADASAPHVPGQGPTLLQGIAHGLQAGRTGFQDTLQQILQQRVQGPQLQQQLRTLQARQQIQQQFPDLAKLSPDQLKTALPKLAMQYVQAGDLETANGLAGLMRTLGIDHPAQFQAVQAGDKIYRFDPTTGQFTPGPERGLSADQLAENAQNRQLRALQIENTKAIAEERAARGAATQFLSENRDLMHRAEIIATARASLAEAQAGNPAALKSAIIGMASVADPKAQLRQGVIEMVAKVDPSARGSLEMALDRITTGTLPPRILKDIEALVNRHVQNYIDLYDQRRQGFLKRAPAAATYLPTTDEVFTVGGVRAVPTGAMATPAAPADLYDRYGLTPPSGRPP